MTAEYSHIRPFLHIYNAMYITMMVIIRMATLSSTADNFRRATRKHLAKTMLCIKMLLRLCCFLDCRHKLALTLAFREIRDGVQYGRQLASYDKRLEKLDFVCIYNLCGNKLHADDILMTFSITIRVKHLT